MKKLIKASKGLGTIFEDENFEFVKQRGTGMNDTLWSGLAVRTKDGSLAEKHVVRIDLETGNNPIFDGEPVEYKYYSDAVVSHGMRMKKDTLKDTQEYIAVLEDAVDFAERVNAWLEENDEYLVKRRK